MISSQRPPSPSHHENSSGQSMENRENFSEVKESDSPIVMEFETDQKVLP